MNNTLEARVAPLTQRMVLLISALLACTVELAPWRQPVLVTLAGLWLLLGAPAWLCRRIAARVVSTRDGQWLLGAGFAVVTAIVVALLVNTILPLAGVTRPLTTASLAVGQLIALGALALVDRRLSGSSPAVTWPRLMPVRAVAPVLLLGAGCVLFAVAGAIRLNNGLGGGTSLIAVFLIAALLVLLLVRRRGYGDGLIALGVFCAAAALLLLTSLRGWYITGHDIQREFLLYQLTADHGRWDIADYPDAYNACLSITLFPTSISQLTALPGLAVFKVVLPLLFAGAPVAVYRTARNVASKPIALLAAVYFVAFPTFFTDMPFLGRQEVAFLLLGCAVLVLSDRRGPRRARRVAFIVLFVGIVLSHYSTTYVLIAVLVMSKLAGAMIRVLPGLRRRLAERAPQEARRDFVAWPMIGIAVVSAALWTGPITNTWQQVQTTTVGTIQDLLDPGNAQRGSSDTSYSLFGDTRISPQERLQDYAKATSSQNGGEPQSAVDGAATKIAPAGNLPLTAAGSWLSAAGVNVTAANGFLRVLCADGLQVLLLIGLAGTIIAAATVFRPTHDLFVLAVGSVAVIAVETVVPQLSVDYGVLRTFQQGLFLFAPFIAMASVWIFSWLKRFRLPAAIAMAMFFFLDLTGGLPRLVGGYPAQLHLDNAGQYYDIYFVHPQERAGITWLEQHATDTTLGAVQSEVQTDRYTFSRSQTLLKGRTGDDIFPTLIRPDSFVFLGYTTVHKDQATVFYQGDLLTYTYPLEFLDNTKNKVYSSNGSSVYR